MDKNIEKSSASALLEYCTRMKYSSPVFDLIRDGKNVDLLFTYRVKVHNLTATGSGRSKKIAKHDAAEKMLTLLDERNSEKFLNATSESDSDVAQTKSVSELLTFCRSYGHSVPMFSLVESAGPSHSPKFTYECKVSTFFVTATDKTKKGAKHESAAKMIAVLRKSTPAIEIEPIEVLCFNGAGNDIMKRYFEAKTALKKNKIESTTSNLDYYNYKCHTDDNKKEIIKRIYLNHGMNDEAKVKSILSILNLGFEISRAPSISIQQRLLFRIMGADSVVIGSQQKIYEEVLKYLCMMLYEVDYEDFIKNI